MLDHIRFVFRGQTVELKGFRPTLSVLDWLREHQRATGTKEGCNEGDCGACTAVVVRMEGGRPVHRPINTCITFVGMLHGCELLTIEDLSRDGRLHPIQQAMVEQHGSQCGFCTPGIVMSLFAMAQDGGPVTRERINDQLAGNLCRCTGYRPIVDAAMASLGAADAGRSRLTPANFAAIDAPDSIMVAEGNQFFAAPATLTDLLALYAAHPDATILAGATDVGLWITKQFRPVSKLIWLGRVPELRGIDDSPDELTIGAGVPHDDALQALAAISSDLGELGRRFGSKQVRAQGTVGGNIANGSPIGDWAPAFIALGADVTLARAGAPQRVLALESFFIAYGRQDRQPGEIVQAIRIRKPQKGEHFRCFKISKRFDEDISAVMGAFRLTISGGKVTEARVAFGGMAATPKRGAATEAALAGVKLSDRATWEAAIAALAEDYRPIDDMRASARYRLETARALLTKALIEIGGGAGTRLHQPPALAAE